MENQKMSIGPKCKEYHECICLKSGHCMLFT